MMARTLLHYYEGTEIAIQHEETYPYEDYIINVNSSTTTNCELVTWLFPNNEMVQLLFYTPENSEIFSVSTALVLPDEGEEGQFFTRGEITLFLSQVLRV
ncbi:hypothetical protein [Ammoniphilus sp. CFH 90114]|uniref:hypothetical protein n=1 Tax=Ammoniphilus sp. CFH 90114 TaxID=2493665 RepID=UPI00100F14B7|nr:hypothetical protein [Ammoniphilus sp. CFH 90114]RXT08794.1 hypothetical protein EIZ39_08295 [Ammoniphilus sp. CFH 90114]